MSPLAAKATIIAAAELRSARPECRGAVLLEQVALNLRSERLVIQPLLVHEILVASALARVESEHWAKVSTA